MKEPASILKGIHIALRHPYYGAKLLAQTLHGALSEEHWLTRELKVQFCIELIKCFIDPALEPSLDRKLLERIQKRSLLKGIKLLKRNPDTGIKLLAALVASELNDSQKFSLTAQRIFFEELSGCFFPELTTSEPLYSQPCAQSSSADCNSTMQSA
jgi:hypothetical protein